MKENLLIVGSGTLALIAKEIAVESGCFEKIAFVDNNISAIDGTEVIGKLDDLVDLNEEYKNIIVAIAESDARIKLLKKIEEETFYRIVSLVSKSAYVSNTAQIGKNCIVEPMSCIGAGTVISSGCIVSYGAVVDSCSLCGDGVNVGCNATVPSHAFVPGGTTVEDGIVLKN